MSTASHVRLDRRVAVKILTGSLVGNRDALRRFEREARAAARLEHLHITRTYDYDAIGIGRAYMVMELLSGRTCASSYRTP
jgi:serine/threonine-protein kinase